MELIINGYIIDSDIEEILESIRDISGGVYCRDIIRRGDNVGVNCPFHKGGQESHPSCYVYNIIDDDNIPYGYFKCFTCDEKGPLYKLVAKCLGYSFDEAKLWLVTNFSSGKVTPTKQLKELEELHVSRETTISESDLEPFMYIHPYILKRGISEEIVKRFKIGWDQNLDAITFPVWDEAGILKGVTKRYINKKRFFIPEDLNKPVYLLNYIKQHNIKEAYVVESQIDALYLWSLGYPAVALFGTGAKHQYDILNKSGIRSYHLALDGDLAGHHGNLKLINSLSDSCLVDVLLLPDGKDINDLSKAEIDSLVRLDKFDYLQKDYLQLKTNVV